MISRRLVLQSIGAAWQSYYWGKDEPLPRQIELSAGPVSMVFEPDLAFLRYIRLGQEEILRGVYAAVRDRNWGTVAPRVTGLRVETRDDSFQLAFDVNCREGDVDFYWRGEIAGDAAGTVRFAMKGESRSTFLRNRIGFCVLHPLKECAGKPCRVRHADGREVMGRFPSDVSPHQPFKDMAAISHTLAGGVSAEVAFEGEIFEMEDHRNWTDANYKTYCTPLERPYPVEVKDGRKIDQAVTIRLQGNVPRKAAAFVPKRREIAVTLTGGSSPLPRIGLGLSGSVLDDRELRRIVALKPAHLRVDLKLADAEHVNVLGRAVVESQRSKIPLEIAVHLKDAPEEALRGIAAKLATATVARYLIFHANEKSTNAKWVTLARQHLKNAPAGVGTDAYFAELNRERPETAAADFLSFSINPQVHAFDNASLVENLAGQGDAVLSAKKFAGGKPVIISPVTFKPRFNPNATGGELKLPPDVLPPRFDARQLSLFGAAWTAGSIKYLAESGVQSATYHETAGPGGVIETTRGSQWAKAFPSRAGQTFPLYHVLADVIEFAGGDVRECVSESPLAIECLILEKAGRVRILAANLTAEAQAIRIPWPERGPKHPPLRVRKLDEHSLRTASDAPETFRAEAGDSLTLRGLAVELSLAPYAVARLDSGA